MKPSVTCSWIYQLLKKMIVEELEIKVICYIFVSRGFYNI